MGVKRDIKMKTHERNNCIMRFLCFIAFLCHSMMCAATADLKKPLPHSCEQEYHFLLCPKYLVLHEYIDGRVMSCREHHIEKSEGPHSSDAYYQWGDQKLLLRVQRAQITLIHLRNARPVWSAFLSDQSTLIREERQSRVLLHFEKINNKIRVKTLCDIKNLDVCDGGMINKIFGVASAGVCTNFVQRSKDGGCCLRLWPIILKGVFDLGIECVQRGEVVLHDCISKLTEGLPLRPFYSEGPKQPSQQDYNVNECFRRGRLYAEVAQPGTCVASDVMLLSLEDKVYSQHKCPLELHALKEGDHVAFYLQYSKYYQYFFDRYDFVGPVVLLSSRCQKYSGALRYYFSFERNLRVSLDFNIVTGVIGVHTHFLESHSQHALNWKRICTICQEKVDADIGLLAFNYTQNIIVRTLQPGQFFELLFRNSSKLFVSNAISLHVDKEERMLSIRQRIMLQKHHSFERQFWQERLNRDDLKALVPVVRMAGERSSLKLGSVIVEVCASANRTDYFNFSVKRWGQSVCEGQMLIVGESGDTWVFSKDTLSNLCVWTINFPAFAAHGNTWIDLWLECGAKPLYWQDERSTDLMRILDVKAVRNFYTISHCIATNEKGHLSWDFYCQSEKICSEDLALKEEEAGLKLGHPTRWGVFWDGRNIRVKLFAGQREIAALDVVYAPFASRIPSPFSVCLVPESKFAVRCMYKVLLMFYNQTPVIKHNLVGQDGDGRYYFAGHCEPNSSS